MKKLSLIITLSVIISGCCIFDWRRSTFQTCNFEEAICAKNEQALQSSIEKFTASGGMYLVYNVTQNKAVEKNYVNFDKSMKIKSFLLHLLFSFTVGLNDGTVSPNNIDFFSVSSHSWKIAIKVDGSDNKKRIFNILGVDEDGDNTIRQLLFGYLNVLTNKDNLLTEVQLSALKSSVFSDVNKENTQVQVKNADVHGLADVYPYRRKFGQEMTLFVGTFKAHNEDYAIFAALDSPHGIPYVCLNTDTNCNVVPMVKRIIENISQ